MGKQVALEKKTIRQVLLVLGIIFVAFNLRPAITAIGPIIGLIRNDLGISNGVAGFITTLPLLSFAILSILAPRIGQVFGNERTVFFGLIVLFIGIVIRSTGFISTLFLGTILVGVGVAIGNVLLPSIVKLKFPEKVGIMTSTYTTSMNTFAALGSGISIPLAQGLALGWQKALAVWAVIAVIAAVIWLPQSRRNNQQTATQNSQSSSKDLWQSPLAWQVTIFMGLQSFLFYCTVAWLPEILESNGMDLSLAGWMLSLMQLVGLPTTFFAPVLAGRFKNQKGIVLTIGFFYFAGIMGILLGASHALLVVSIICIGVAQGASISLALTFIGLRTINAKQAADLSGMAQSIGYLLAAIGPILIGFLFDQTHSWTLPLIVLSIVAIVMILAGLGAGRNQYIVKEQHQNYDY
ncbi:CynX/NimT family MFS transporter [Bacillus seohaeanensis]|jgi:MFS transporter, CP family, cyanate transporter|uniref:CynX/NimT family MFS transporter n=1 Tax=Bacillus seohaeanensis TaxID=284580 RepID=A0ABW5RP12_9BACI